jgi:hypothetical protein
MSPNVAALPLDVVAPDVSRIVTEDDTPVDNIYSEKQQRLLTGALFASWSGPPPEEDGLPRTFVATANVGLFGSPTEPPMVPDVLVSLDVSYQEPILEKAHRTYFVWVFGKAPDVVIEVVSNREGGELTERKKRYRRLHIPNYVVWDPEGHLSDAPLQVFELRGSLYGKKDAAFFDALGLGLAAWEGVFEGVHARWLRWVDARGVPLPTGEERAQTAESRAQTAESRAQTAESRAQTAESRAQTAEERAARLAEKLRALGAEPD